MSSGAEKNQDVGRVERAISDACLDVLFVSARSYNAYRDKPIDEALLRKMWHLASLGPTSANMSPARIVWCSSREAREKLAGFASTTNAKKIFTVAGDCHHRYGYEVCGQAAVSLPAR